MSTNNTLDFKTERLSNKTKFIDALSIDYEYQDYAKNIIISAFCQVYNEYRQITTKQEIGQEPQLQEQAISLLNSDKIKKEGGSPKYYQQSFFDQQQNQDGFLSKSQEDQANSSFLGKRNILDSYTIQGANQVYNPSQQNNRASYSSNQTQFKGRTFEENFQQDDIVLSSDGSDAKQQQFMNHPQGQFHNSNQLNYQQEFGKRHFLRSSSNEDDNSDGEYRIPSMMQESLDVLSANLNKLNDELFNQKNMKGKKKQMSIEDIKKLQKEDEKYRRRKIPESSSLFLKQDNGAGQGDDNNSQRYWLSILKSQIVDESLNESFKERRRELLAALELMEDPSQSIVIAKPKKNHQNLNQEGFRGSVFRGVSKNKSKWQMMIMGNFKKMYIGAIEQEREAALVYDRIAILVHGLKAKTNFDYSKQDVISFLNEEGLDINQPLTINQNGDHL